MLQPGIHPRAYRH